MPDGPATPPPPEAGSAAPPVDELAKDLPGLPVKVWKWRVDHDGFHRKPSLFGRPSHIGWSELRKVDRRFDDLSITYQRGGRLISRNLVGSGRTRCAKAVEAAWREYQLRRIERDGALEGTVLARVEGLAGRMFTAALFLGVVVFFVWGALRPKNPNSLAWWGGAIVMLVLGIKLAVLQPARAKEIRDNWSRWRLRPDGLEHWAIGVRRAIPIHDVMDSRDIPWARLTGRDTLLALVHALGERQGLKLQGESGYSGLLSFLKWLLILTVLYAMGLGWTRGLLLGCTSAGMIAFPAFVADRLASRKTPAIVADGRAMLERLGW